jgi:hypothetical protein
MRQRKGGRRDLPYSPLALFGLRAILLDKAIPRLIRKKRRVRPLLSSSNQAAYFSRTDIKIRTDEGFENYLSLAAGHYRIRVFLNGKEHLAITADPHAGTIEVNGGVGPVTLSGHIEIKLERE